MADDQDDKCGKIFKVLSAMVDDCEDYLRERAHACDEFQQVLRAKEKDLPVLAATRNAAIRKLVLNRINGMNIDSPENWMAVLGEQPFDGDMEKNDALVKNNGMLMAISTVAKELGYKDLVKRASSLIADSLKW